MSWSIKRWCQICFLWLQAQHAYEEHEPSSRQFQVGEIAPGGFTSGVVGQWGSYVDICGDSVPWDDIEHVGSRTPTTWNIMGVHDNSQNKDTKFDMELDLALNGHSFTQ